MDAVPSEPSSACPVWSLDWFIESLLHEGRIGRLVRLSHGTAGLLSRLLSFHATVGDTSPGRGTGSRAGGRNRGSLAVWFSKEAVAAWKGLPSGKQGGQHRHSELAIDAALTLRMVFRLAHADALLDHSGGHIVPFRGRRWPDRSDCDFPNEQHKMRFCSTKRGRRGSGSIGSCRITRQTGPLFPIPHAGKLFSTSQSLIGI
jgi:Transposase DDE domain